MCEDQEFETKLLTNFSDLENGARIWLYPNSMNSLHPATKYRRIAATYSEGYFYCDGSDPLDGPDYYFGDVHIYNYGYTPHDN